MQTAADLAAAYAAGETSPLAVTQVALAAIARDQPTYNAWAYVAGDQALADAAQSQARWARGTPLSPLDGVPVGVKDLVAVAGQPMRRGSQAWPADFIPTEDAPMTARLREAGAILIGKTTTPDSGHKLDTASLAHGITRNPHNPNLTAGGSSGGSAVALALGHVPLAIGTDGGGSIRIPAAFCGVFGLKPTSGRIPGLLGPFWPHSAAGPMSVSVADTALAWNVVCRPDARDPYALPASGTDWAAESAKGVAGLRVAVTDSFHGIGASGDITAAVRRAAGILADAGAAVSRAEPAWPCDPLSVFITFWRCMYEQSVAMIPPAQAALVDPAIKTIVASAGNISRLQFQQAMIERDLLAVAMAQFHQSYDLLLCPVMPCQPWPAGRATPPPFAEDDWAWCPFTYPFNLTRQPAASIPCGTDAAGLPLGVQLIGPAWGDGLVLRAAKIIESETNTGRHGLEL